MFGIKQKILDIREKLISFHNIRINRRNRKRLTNLSPTIIASDCTGGILYKWLGLKFNSPFINLYMDSNDFITALEHFDDFIAGEIVEDKSSSKPWPVGIGVHGERLHFMHYPDFATAVNKWNERKARINKCNMGVIFSNCGEGLSDTDSKEAVLKRFQQLDFKNKIILSCESYGIPESFRLKGYDPRQCINICYNDKYGRRPIDQYDYVGFINSFQTP